MAHSLSSAASFVLHPLETDDTLPAIALYYGVTEQAIRSANGLYPNESIHLRKELRIPGTSKRVKPRTDKAKAASAAMPAAAAAPASAAAAAASASSGPAAALSLSSAGASLSPLASKGGLAGGARGRGAGAAASSNTPASVEDFLAKFDQQFTLAKSTAEQTLRHSSFSAGATPTGSPRRRSREAFVDYTVADLSSPASSPRMGRATHTGAAAAASPSLLAGNAVAPLSAATLRKTDRLKLASREDMLEDDDDMFEL